MIGLGVGIDYALFIVTRYRDAYRQNGGDVQAALELAMNTAGRAILFAGATVVIALLGMFALGVSFLYGAAIAAFLGVLLVLAASLTLLPALLMFTGKRIGRARRGSRPRAARAGFAGTRPAARHERLRQRPHEADHATRIRPARRGLRQRIQRPAAARRPAGERQ